MADILLNMLSKIGEYSVSPTIRQVRYLFLFKSTVEDLKEESEKLGSKQARVQHDVCIAEQNAEAIEEDVRKWLSVVEGDMKEVQNLDEKIQGNKRCLCGWCPNLIWRYNLGKDVMKKTATIKKLQEDGKFDRVSYRTRIEFIPAQQVTPFGSTKSAFNQIMDALKADECNMIGLYGTGGLGKTTLAKEVGKRAKELKLFDNVVMAVVSQNPDFTKIQDQIVEWLGMKFEEKTKEGRASRLFSRLMNEKNILIILDDVWKNLNLAEDIGIPFGDDHKGCKILLTTRRLQVCNVMRSKKNIPLNALSKEEAWALFKNSSGLDDNSPTLNYVAMEVVGECKGLPLAIVTVGSALKGKTLDEYKLASKQLKSSKLVDIEDVDKDVYGSLQLSYNYLKSEKTKSCFLLCSLFPEDHEIDIEDLVKYGMGLDLFHGADSIEEARSQLRVMINNLKDSSLLLEASQQQFLKMHDVVRDVALWIASKGENVFMVRAGDGLTEWPKEDGFEQYTAISLMANKIQVLPSKLDCPRLEILLLGGKDSVTVPKSVSMTVPDSFFEGMKALKVLTLSRGSLFPQSLEFLTNLTTLQLEHCEFNDISSLGKLERLEVLSFHGSYMEELPNEVGELKNLRLLDLTECRRLKRFPPNVIRRLAQLEELYIGSNSFKGWEIKGESAERSNASISELNSLARLAMLSMKLNLKCLPQDFSFHNLLRYDISLIRDSRFFSADIGTVEVSDYPHSRKLVFNSIDASSELNAFKELFKTVESLSLQGTCGCQNIIPNMDQRGLNDLISLSLESCDEMECLIDSTNAFSNLMHLSLHEMAHLRKIPYADQPSKGFIRPPFFSKLTTLDIRYCEKLKYIFPISIARGLRQLEKLKILDCPQLKQVFNHEKEEDVFVGDGNDIMLPELKVIKLVRLSSLTSFYEGNYHWMWPSLQELTVEECPKLTTSFMTDLEANLSALQKQLRVLRITDFSFHKVFHGISTERVDELSVSNLTKLILKDLPELRVIWKGPTQITSFQNLTLLQVINCKKLKHIFSQNLSRNLPRLEYLHLSGCEELERIICEEDKDEEDQITSFKDHLQQPVCFPNLWRIWVVDCNKLKSLFPITIAPGLPKLNDLYVTRVSQLKEVFSHENEDVRNEKKIVLPQLHKLTFKQLSRLISFCPSGYHFIFPFLNELVVRECPNITTSFTITLDRAVHAKAKAETPQLVKEDMPEGSSTTQATVVTMPSHSIIDWCRYPDSDDCSDYSWDL